MKQDPDAVFFSFERRRWDRKFRSKSPGFRTVHLNFVGWSALVGAGLTVGAVLWLATPLNMFVALLVGIVAVWATLGALDYRRWRNSKVHRSSGGMTPEAGREIVARLHRMGIEVKYEELEDDPEDGGEIHRGIIFRNADKSLVERVMREVLG